LKGAILENKEDGK